MRWCIAKFFADVLLDTFGSFFGSGTGFAGVFVPDVFLVVAVAFFVTGFVATTFFAGAFGATFAFAGAFAGVFAVDFAGVFVADFLDVALVEAPALAFQPKRFNLPTTAFFDIPKRLPISDVDNPLPISAFSFFNAVLSQPLLMIKSLLPFVIK